MRHPNLDRMELKRFVLLAGVVACAAFTVVPASADALGVTMMKSFAAPGTLARYDKVGVIKIGPRSAKNVLVLEPGTSAGSAYFVPLAKWLVSTVKGWQGWSVERRENLGGPAVTAAATALARQSHIPMRNLTLLNRQSTYAHNDPAGAFPHNVFFNNLVKFVNRVARG
jgi:hypothetical protein